MQTPCCCNNFSLPCILHFRKGNSQRGFFSKDKVNVQLLYLQKILMNDQHMIPSYKKKISLSYKCVFSLTISFCKLCRQKAVDQKKNLLNDNLCKSGHKQVYYLTSPVNYVSLLVFLTLKSFSFTKYSGVFMALWDFMGLFMTYILIPYHQGHCSLAPI